MADIPKRDITGECEGECKDRVYESYKERQAEMKNSDVETPESFPNAPNAENRSTPPGALGGHV